MPNGETPGFEASLVDGLLSAPVCFAGSALTGAPKANGAGDGVGSIGLAAGVPNNEGAGAGAAGSASFVAAGAPNLKGVEGAAETSLPKGEEEPKPNRDGVDKGSVDAAAEMSLGSVGSTAGGEMAGVIDVTGNADTGTEVEGKPAKPSRGTAGAASAGFSVAAGAMPDSLEDGTVLAASATFLLGGANSDATSLAPLSDVGGVSENGEVVNGVVDLESREELAKKLGIAGLFDVLVAG